ncbi:hypothetical protein PF049_02310 [Erythrobacteraceae bacterium WH01K]|nr:hypothetical protein PF049_02310 [Erythrobacteraceae bacterium WH01K]
MNEVRNLLQGSGGRKAKALDTRIGRWCSNRPYRNLLAHASVRILFDEAGQKFLQTRHLPRDLTDVTPDRVWTEAECQELLRQVTNDGRSICDHVDALLADSALIKTVRGH